MQHYIPLIKEGAEPAYKELEFCVPSNLDVRKALKDAGKSNYYIETNIDKFNWFFSTLHYHSTLNRKYEIGSFIPMQHTTMLEVMGDKRYVNDLKNIFGKRGVGVFETNYNPVRPDGKKNILKGRQSIGYRLTSKYQVRHLRVLEDSRYSGFIQKLHAMMEADIASMDFVTSTQSFHLQDLGIYAEEAEAYVESWFEENLSKESEALLKELKRKNKARAAENNKLRREGVDCSLQVLTFRQMLENMRESYLHQIHAVHHKTWLPKRDRKGKRLHSFITSLWTDLRRFLYYLPDPGMQLVSLDCSNSQPFALVKVILDYFKRSEGMPDDCLLYIKLVQEGGLYRFLWQENGRSLDEEGFLSFKTDLFAFVFYAETHKVHETELSQLFRNHFPTVHQIIVQEKRHDHASLAIEMQRIESEAVLDGALSHLYHKYQDKVPFYTLHDSVICPKEYEAEVREVIISHYERVVGATPHIKQGELVNAMSESRKVPIPIVSPKSGVRPAWLTGAGDLKDYRKLTSDDVFYLQWAADEGCPDAERVLKHASVEYELDFIDEDSPRVLPRYWVEKKLYKEYLKTA